MNLMISKKFKKDRRELLSLLTKTGFTMPLAAGMLGSRYSFAQQFNKRVIFIFASNGSPDGKWLPQGNGAGMQMRAGTKDLNDIKTLCNFRETTLGAGANHGNEFKALGRLRYGPVLDASSVDVQIANAIGGATPFKNVFLGIANKDKFVSRELGTAKTFIKTPAAAFKTYFSGAGGGGGDQGGADQNALRLQSILDSNLEELKALRNKLGAAERIRLEKHEEAIASLEKRLMPVNNGSGNAGAGCGADFSPTGVNDGTPFTKIVDAQNEVAVLALQCGITKVVTMMYDESQGAWGQKTPDGSKEDVPEFTSNHDYHQSFHNRSQSQANNVLYTNFIYNKMGNVVRLLAETDDPMFGGKMIDNTVLVSATDMGDGANHTAPNAPSLVACGKNITGLKRGTSEKKAGKNHYDVLGDVVKGLGLAGNIGSEISNLGGGTGILS